MERNKDNLTFEKENMENWRKKNGKEQKLKSKQTKKNEKRNY